MYLNSLWNVHSSIIPLMALRVARRSVPVLLAPRGELSEGALRIRPRRKRLLIMAYRALRIDRSIAWHASTDMEAADIRRVFGSEAKCHVAVDLRADIHPVPRPAPTAHGGPLRALFLSRIAPMKNLDGLLRALCLAKVDLELTIAGPIDDPGHWKECQRLMSALPHNVSVRVHGAVAPTDVVDFMSGFDLFVLPTHGENYGHAVLEALTARLPVIVGSNTPWRRVEESEAGWLVDSTSPKDIARAIGQFAELSPRERDIMRDAAAGVACMSQDQGEAINAHRRMFLELAMGESISPGSH